ncbi:MAG: Putative 4,5-dihydroxyphthalate dehydrogenase [Candidatus Moanabacter tarae]|uniref:4,5-dihydroxyphthalate dehydrogenase n=1 Tax=Candidatus Moanibacter tarae TaxID=2200854 RepID=A0A2Z4AKN2_9BACT|nr:MAG: Putative 4,5-dihydroxyphthalate dehydrogenase [Candidatus Moanabacter tarae]
MNSEKPHKVLVIGCGSIGERHLRCFLSTGRAAVTGCDVNEELLAQINKNYNTPVTTDWELALQDPTTTAAVVATPANLHVEMATMIMEAGKHVLIEKPLSVGMEGTEGLIELRDRQGLVAAVGYVHRSIPTLRSIQSFLGSGEFGDILLLTITCGQDFAHYRPAYREIYFADHKKGGGAIQDGITHLINWIEWITGPIETVYCDAAHQLLEGVEVEDTVNILARSGKTLINCSYNLFQAPNEYRVWIHCERGSVMGDVQNQKWGTLASGEENWNWRDANHGERDILFVTQANDFLDQIEGRSTQLSSLEEGIQTLRVNLASLESSRSGTQVRI